MVRCRFKTRSKDYRPIHWSINHPYWCSGESDGAFVIVAYADDENEILTNWPEAEDLDYEYVEEYEFTDRFPKSFWFEGAKHAS
jgi:hypothetical protein